MLATPNSAVQTRIAKPAGAAGDWWPRVRLFSFYVILGQWTGCTLPLEHLLFGIPHWPDALLLEAGNPLHSFLNAFAAMIGAMTMVRILVFRRDLVWRYFFYIAFFTFCLASTAWSVLPIVTLRRATNDLSATFLIIEWLEELGPLTVMSTLVYEELIVAVLSLYYRFFVKQLGIFPGTHDLGGIFGHKNVMGANVAVAILPALLMAFMDTKRRRFFLGAAALFYLCDLMTFSATAIVLGSTYLLFAGLGVMIVRGGTYRMAAISALGFLGLCLAVFALAPDVLFFLLQKDSTLTGRTELWTYVHEEIAKRPWFGWGFEGFWETESPDAAAIWKKLGWVVPQAHNGYLEITIELGWVGWAWFMLMLVYAGITSLRLFLRRNWQVGLLVGITLVGMVLFSLSEGDVFGQDVRSLMFIFVNLYGIWAVSRRTSAVELEAVPIARPKLTTVSLAAIRRRNDKPYPV